MSRSWTVLTVRGIPIRLHFTLLLFLPYVAFVAAAQFRVVAGMAGVELSALTLPPALWGVILAVGLFVGIVLHELAHSFVALSSGAGVESITLMMLGGVSRITGDIRSPGREAWMAAAGPLTSFVIGAASLGLVFILPDQPPDLALAALIFGQINIVIAIFNLLPAFPMDGGRILRAALTPRLGRLRATKAAARVGRVMAVLFGLFALLPPFKPILLLIAVFIYLGASAEASTLEARLSLRGLRAGTLVDPRVAVVTPDTPLSELAERFLRENLVAVEVADGADYGPPGLVTVWDLEHRGRGSAGVTAGQAARREVPRVPAASDASELLGYLLGERGAAVVVVDEWGRTLGVVSGQELTRARALSHYFEDDPPRREGP